MDKMMYRDDFEKLLADTRKKIKLRIGADRVGTPNSSSRNGAEPMYIVVHYSGVKNAGVDAVVEGMLKESQKTSAHFVVNGTRIEQVVSIKKAAWHIGDGAINNRYETAPLAHRYEAWLEDVKLIRPKNVNSIGVELCVEKAGKGKSVSDTDWRFNVQTLKTAAELIAFLIQKYDITITRVIRHADVTGKPCPRPFVTLKADGNDDNDILWAAFKSRIEENARDFVYEAKIK